MGIPNDTLGDHGAAPTHSGFGLDCWSHRSSLTRRTEVFAAGLVTSGGFGLPCASFWTVGLSELPPGCFETYPNRSCSGHISDLRLCKQLRTSLWMDNRLPISRRTMRTTMKESREFTIPSPILLTSRNWSEIPGNVSSSFFMSSLTESSTSSSSRLFSSLPLSSLYGSQSTSPSIYLDVDACAGAKDPALCCSDSKGFTTVMLDEVIMSYARKKLGLGCPGSAIG